MSLRFVTRKLKTQTLGDDDADVEIDNTGVDQPGATNQNREKTEVSICISTKSNLLLRSFIIIQFCLLNGSFSCVCRTTMAVKESVLWT